MCVLATSSVDPGSLIGYHAGTLLVDGSGSQRLESRSALSSDQLRPLFAYDSLRRPHMLNLFHYPSGSLLATIMSYLLQRQDNSDVTQVVGK